MTSAAQQAGVLHAAPRTMCLYPAQAEGVEWALKGPRPIRRTLAWGTGCGKTAGALHIAQGAGVRRMLVVCPAIVRRHWAAEVRKWWPEAPEVGVIEWGKNRKLSAKEAAVRTKAYEAPIQVVSYDLCREISLDGWDMVVIDELHNLGNPHGVQALWMRLLVKRNPLAHVLGLSATLIPTHIRQLWHPQYLIHGSSWGRPSRAGGVSWQFIYEYLEVISTEYGKMPGPLREDKREALLEKLSKVCHRLTREDILGDMDPIDVTPLYVQQLSLEVFHDWFSALAEDSTHAVIFTHHRNLAKQVVKKLGGDTRIGAFHVVYVDGAMSPGARHEVLEQAAQAPKALVVATMDSLSEGIRLLWAHRVLITEFRQSPGRMAQLFGRFSAVGSDARPKVEVVVPDTDTDSAAHLLSRLADVNAVIRGGAGEKALGRTFAKQPLTEQRISGMFAAMLGSFNAEAEDWSDDHAEGQD